MSKDTKILHFLGCCGQYNIIFGLKSKRKISEKSILSFMFFLPLFSLSSSPFCSFFLSLPPQPNRPRSGRGPPDPTAPAITTVGAHVGASFGKRPLQLLWPHTATATVANYMKALRPGCHRTIVASSRHHPRRHRVPRRYLGSSSSSPSLSTPQLREGVRRVLSDDGDTEGNQCRSSSGGHGGTWR